MTLISSSQRLDRQTRTLGIEATHKLSESSCLIVNLGGLGVEIGMLKKIGKISTFSYFPQALLNLTV